jgi:glutamate dehydrogenase
MELWKKIESLDLKVKVSVQQKMMLQIYFLIRRATRWFLRNRQANIPIEETIAIFQPLIKELKNELPKLLSANDKELLENEIKALTDEGVPETLAQSTSVCEILFTSLDIVEMAMKHQFAIADVAKTYYTLDSILEMSWLRHQMNIYPIDNQWDELARSRFRDDLERAQSKLSVNVLKFKSKKLHDKTIEERANAWLQTNPHLVSRWQDLLAEVKSSSNVDFVAYSVILRELYDFSQTS